MIDTHAHLDSKEFDSDLELVLDRCRQKNVVLVVSCGTDLDSSKKNLILAEKYEALWASVGIHPHEAYRVDENTADALKAMALHEKCVAIGETGLDYYYNFSLPESQCKSLKLQIRLARELRLPLILHCRNAEEDLLNILSQEHAEEVGGVIHSFAGRFESAKKFLALGFYLGVSGIFTFKNAGNLAENFSKLPLEKLLLETDSPYLAPVPHRGKRNEPAFVTASAAKLAELKNITFEEVEEKTTQNALRLFSKINLKSLRD